MVKKHWGCVLVWCLVHVFDVTAQIPKDKWVDSVFSRMSTADRIAQLFMVRVSADQDEASLNDLESKLRSNAIGGVLFTRGQAPKVAKVVNRFQSASKVPLMVGVDGSANHLLQI